MTMAPLETPAGYVCVCPGCNGRQYVVAHINIPGRGKPPLTRLVRRICWTCDGKGEIIWPPETAEEREGAGDHERQEP